MIAAPPTLAVDILRFQPQSERTTAMYRALEAACPPDVDLVVADGFSGEARWLMLWGPGHPARFEPMRRQIVSGGHVIAFDLAYWQRETKLRISIDAAHPQAWVMRREWPRDRFLADRVPVADAWNPHGPVIVAGIGEKATVQYGPTVRAWEDAQIAACRVRGWPVLYRPKKHGSAPPSVQGAPVGPIDAVLRGASLVITWHSNVAVDAIRMGIPVVCRDGAAAAVCPSAILDRPEPLAIHVRDRFLGNLAWFQWAPSEAAALWRFLRELLG